MAYTNGTLGDNASSGAKAAIPYISGREERATVYVYGTFTATFSIEVSPDNGTTWVTAKDQNGTALAGLTAGGTWILNLFATQIRMNVTAFTSGTASGRVMFSGG